MKGLAGQKVTTGFQKTSDKLLYPKNLGGNKTVKDPKGPGKGSTRGGPSKKTVTKLGT